MATYQVGRRTYIGLGQIMHHLYLDCPVYIAQVKESDEYWLETFFQPMLGHSPCPQCLHRLAQIEEQSLREKTLKEEAFNQRWNAASKFTKWKRQRPD